MVILGIESSCDETAAAVLIKKNNRVNILSNIVASSAKLQAKYGGIIPEQAAREQLKSIIPVIETAIYDCGLTIDQIDAIAVTRGPGLIGSLLIGVETAKTLSLSWQKPLIPINHLLGHFYANWITPSSLRGATATKQSFLVINKIATPTTKVGARNDNNSIPTFPCLGLLVSGGHTDLVLFKNHGDYQYLGGTRDDASGECFDKCARILGLPYPGGPQLSQLAQKGNPQIFQLPRPMIHTDNFDFSFSGLKTAVANLVQSPEFTVPSNNKNSSNPKSQKTHQLITNHLAASIEQAIIDVLVEKTIKAAKKYQIKNVMIAGGVAANQKLVNTLKAKIESFGGSLFAPPPNLCTDNGAMIAACAFFQKALSDPLKLQADPNLSLVSLAS